MEKTKVVGIKEKIYEVEIRTKEKICVENQTCMRLSGNKEFTAGVARYMRNVEFFIGKTLSDLIIDIYLFEVICGRPSTDSDKDKCILHTTINN